MRACNQIIAIFLLFCIPISCQVKSYSIHRNDNDFASYHNDQYGEREILPLEFSLKVTSIIDQITESIAPDKLDDYYIHKIDVNDDIIIYVLSIESFSLTEHQLFLYNTKTNQISKSKAAINGKWSKNSEEGFNIKLIDLPNIKIQSQGSDYILSIKERVHNGNSYDAVIQKHFRIDFEKLTLTLMYCIEIKAFGYDDVIIERVIDGNIVKVYKRDKNSIEEIGSFILSNNMQSVTYKTCLNDDFCSQLVTCSGVEDQIIIQKGYNN